MHPQPSHSGGTFHGHYVTITYLSSRRAIPSAGQRRQVAAVQLALQQDHPRISKHPSFTLVVLH